MTQYTLITDLPAWMIRLIDSGILFVASLTGHHVVIATIRSVDAYETGGENGTETN